MLTRRIALAGLSLLLTLSGSLASAGGADPKPPKLLVDALDEAATVVILEGLPHPGAERAAFAAEKARPHQMVDGHAFYEAPLTPPADGLRALREALLAPGALIPWEGEKKCGGFHPDLALRATVGDQTLHLHLCFGCGEVRVTGPRLKRPLRRDMTSATREALTRLGRSWRTNRPAPAHE